MPSPTNIGGSSVTAICSQTGVRCYAVTARPWPCAHPRLRDGKRPGPDRPLRRRRRLQHRAEPLFGAVLQPHWRLPRVDHGRHRLQWLHRPLPGPDAPRRLLRRRRERHDAERGALDGHRDAARAGRGGQVPDLDLVELGCGPGGWQCLRAWSLAPVREERTSGPDLLPQADRVLSRRAYPATRTRPRTTRRSSRSRTRSPRASSRRSVTQTLADKAVLIRFASEDNPSLTQSIDCDVDSFSYPAPYNTLPRILRRSPTDASRRTGEPHARLLVVQPRRPTPRGTAHDDLRQCAGLRAVQERSVSSLRKGLAGSPQPADVRAEQLARPADRSAVDHNLVTNFADDPRLVTLVSHRVPGFRRRRLDDNPDSLLRGLLHHGQGRISPEPEVP